VRFGGGLWKKAATSSAMPRWPMISAAPGRPESAISRSSVSPSVPVPDPGRIIGQRGRWMQCAGLRPAHLAEFAPRAARRAPRRRPCPGASHAGGLVCHGGPLPAWRLGAAVTLGGMSKLHRRLDGEAARRADIFGF